MSGAEGEQQEGRVTSEPLEEEDVIKRLEEYSIQPDIVQDTAGGENDSSSSSRESIKDEEGSENGTDEAAAEKSSTTSETETATSDTASDTALVPDLKSNEPQPVKTKKNPFAVLKQRLSLDGKDNHDKEKREQMKQKAKLDKVLGGVIVDSLPQVFVTKYLGSKPSKGLYGLKFTREPVEALVHDISSNKKGSILPLMNVQVSTKGLYMSPHKANKAEEMPIDLGLLPIEFISYGVQDIKYSRIFSYIVVREMSSKSKTLECHAMLCDSMVTARKLALSVSFAFKEYAKTLQGKPYKFKVDLQSPTDAGVEPDVEGNEEEDCDA